MRSARSVLVALALLVSACGVTGQDRPEPLEVDRPTPATTTAPTRAGDAALEIFFVRDQRLAPAARSGTRADAVLALELLRAGPSSTEAAGGLVTALPSQDVAVGEPDAGSGSLTVSVSREFTGITGNSQLLAVAQVVWTLTQFPGVRSVRFEEDGAPLEVPTDGGLTSLPVGRGDYASVAPDEESGSSTAAPPTTARPSTPGG
jgi:hypothetical protein